ncbi:MAG: AAA family ATPase [Archangium sp.]
MTTEHFTQVDFENFGPIKRASLKLTRLHALIGPNDSGKSSTLRALAGAAAMPFRTSKSFFDRAFVSPGPTFSAKRGEWKVVGGLNGVSKAIHDGGALNSSIPEDQRVHWGRTRVLRLDPDELRAGFPLLTDNQPLEFANERGAQLGAVLDAIFSRASNDYLSLEKALIERFPSVSGFRLFTFEQKRSIGIRLKDGTDVAPESMSEGMLYFLAFSVLRHLEPVSLLLVEEPENGLHPARIAEVVRILREISETTQVVMATHSPLVINELRPAEVTLVTRTPEHGTTFTPIAETPNFNERSSVYALGELWLSYADGKTEAPLLAPTGTK